MIIVRLYRTMQNSRNIGAYLWIWELLGQTFQVLFNCHSVIFWKKLWSDITDD